MRNIVRILLVAFCLVPAVAGAAPRQQAAPTDPIQQFNEKVKSDLTGGKATAATPTPTPSPTPDPAKCALIWDPLKLCGLLTGNPEDDMQRVVKRIQGVGRDDMNYAILKAKTANTLASGVRLLCLQAVLNAKDLAEGVAIKDANGVVIPRPDPAFVTFLEDTAELVDALAPGGPLMTQCSGAAQMAKTNTLAFINGVVTGAAGLAAGGIAIP